MIANLIPVPFRGGIIAVDLDLARAHLIRHEDKPVAWLKATFTAETLAEHGVKTVADITELMDAINAYGRRRVAPAPVSANAERRAARRRQKAARKRSRR